MPLSPDALLNGRYRVIETLGQGGNGAVYLAHDLSLAEAPCAIKENLNPSAEAERQFLREATVLAALRHPHLPRVTNHFVIGPNQYLVMDYVAGEDLKARLEANGPLAEAAVLIWSGQIAEALHYLHSRTPPVIHRDIKPANIKLTPENEAVLVDFGLAKIAEAGERTATGAVGLTPGFAPPEQYGGGTDARSDVYAFGATLYNLLTGQVPADGLRRMIDDLPVPAPKTLRPDLSPHVDAALRRALEVEPAARFQTMGAFREALRDPAFRYERQPAPAPAAPATPTPAPMPKRRWRAAGCAAWLAVIAMLGGAVGWFASDSARVAAVARDPWVITQAMALSTQAEQAGFTTAIFALETQAAQSPLGTVIAGAATRLAPTLVAVRVTATLQPASPETPQRDTTPARPPTATAAQASTATIPPVGSPTAAPTPRPFTPQPITVDASGAWAQFTSWQPADASVPFALSPDGATVAFPGNQGVVIYDAVTGEPIRTLANFAAGRAIIGLAQLGDSLLVQWTANGQAEIVQWSILEDRVLKRFSIPGRDLRVSPDLTHFAVRDRYIGVYRLDTGALLFNRGDDGSRQEYAFSPDGQFFALENKANAELYDLRSRQRLRTLIGHGEPALGLVFSPDSQQLISAGGDVWDVATGRRLLVFDSAATRVAVSADGQVIVGNDGSAWRLDTGALIGVFPTPPDTAERMAFIQENQFLLWQAPRQPVRVWALNASAARPTPRPSAAPRPARPPLDALNVPFWGAVERVDTDDFPAVKLSADQGQALMWSAAGVAVYRTADGAKLASLPVTGVIDGAFLNADQVLLLSSRGVERVDLARGQVMQTYALSGRALEASPDGTRFAVQDKYIQVVEVVSGQPLVENLGTPDSRQPFLFSPDGRWLALASQNGVTLVETQSGRTARTLGGHGARTTGLAFTPDSARLVAASGDIWDLTSASAKPLATFSSTAARVTISPDGRLVLTNDGAVWDGRTGQFLGAHNLAGAALSVMPDNQHVLAARRSGGIEVWAVRPPTPPAPPDPPAAAAALAPIALENITQLRLQGWWSSDPLLQALSARQPTGAPRDLGNTEYDGLFPVPAASAIGALSASGPLWLTPATGRSQTLIPSVLNPDLIQEAGYLADRILILKERGGLELWDPGTATLVQRFNLQGQGLVTSPTGDHFALRNGAGVQVIAADSGEAALSLPRLNAGNQTCAFSPDGRYFLAANGAVVERYDLAEGRALRPALISRRAGVAGLHITPDGQTVIAATGDAWDWATGQRRFEFTSTAVLGALSPDGTLLAGNDGAVWETTTGRRVATVLDRRDPARQMAFTADGRHLVWLTEGRQLYVWGAPVAGPAPTPAPPAEALTAADLPRLLPQDHFGRGRWRDAVWSPDGRWLALNTTGNVVLYATTDWRAVRAVLNATVLAFNPSGQALVHDANGLRLIEVETGSPVREFAAYPGATAATFSPDGHLLALAGRVTGDDQLDGLVVLEVARSDLVRISRPGRGRYATPPRLAFTADSTLLVESYPRSITVWDLATNDRLTNPITENSGPAALSPDGQQIAYFTGREFVVEKLDRSRGEVRRLSAAGTAFFPGGIDNPNYFPLDYDFAADGRLLVIYQKTNQRTLRQTVALVEWNIDLPEERGGSVRAPRDLLPLSSGPSGAFTALYRREHPEHGVWFRLSPDRRFLVSLTADGVGRVWSYPGQNEVGRTTTDYTDQAAIFPETATAAVVDALKGLELRDLTGGGRVDVTLPGLFDVTALAGVHPGWLWLISPIDGGGRATLLQLPEGRPVASFEGARFERLGGVDPNGRVLAMWERVSGGWSLNVMALTATQPLLQLGRYPQAGEAVFAPDGARLAVARGKVIELWNLHTGLVEHRLARAREAGNFVFSPDGTRLAAATGEIWRITDGAVAASFDSTTDRIVFGPTGDYLLGLDGTYWRAVDGQPIEQLNNVSPDALDVVFVNGGRALLWQLQGGLMQVWGLPE